MDFTCEGRVKYPQTRVYEALRDDLTKLVPFLPNVATIEQLERKDTGGTVTILNKWRAEAGSAPAAARPFLKPEMLEWLDHAAWNNDALLVDWWLEAPSFKKLYACKGTNKVVADGEGTCRVVIRGTLTVDPDGIPGVPFFLAKKVVPLIEGYLLERIKPNMEQLAVGVGQYLEKIGG